MYNFQRVGVDALAATRTVWEHQIAQLAGEVAPSMYEGVLAFADQCVNGTPDRGMHAYGLFRDGEQHACAVLQISYVQVPGQQWLKVLEITVEPRLDVSDGDGASPPIRELAKLAASALVESLGLTYETHPCDTLKVYGRTPFTVDFLQGVYANLSGHQDEELGMGREGNWFVIR